MDDIRRLLLENKAWAKERAQINPDYFIEMARDQTPTFLWIGCSDSRVPPNEITGSNPGELFVARNVANLVIHTDLNLMSVLEYAVNALNVKHIIICGHYGCGGVKAAMGQASLGMINKWIRNIKDVRHRHHAELAGIPDEAARFDRLVELNVMEQAENLTHTSIVQRAWANGKPLHIHGWVYAMASGLLHTLATYDSTYELPASYRYDFNL